MSAYKAFVGLGYRVKEQRRKQFFNYNARNGPQTVLRVPKDLLTWHASFELAEGSPCDMGSTGWKRWDNGPECSCRY